MMNPTSVSRVTGEVRLKKKTGADDGSTHQNKQVRRGVRFEILNEKEIVKNDRRCSCELVEEDNVKVRAGVSNQSDNSRVWHCR